MQPGAGAVWIAEADERVGRQSLLLGSSFEKLGDLRQADSRKAFEKLVYRVARFKLLDECLDRYARA